MNDRIKEFGRQASELALEEYRTRQKTEFAGDVIYSDIYDQKFAQIIIFECIKLAVFEGDSATAKTIKKHFGIE